MPAGQKCLSMHNAAHNHHEAKALHLARPVWALQLQHDSTLPKFPQTSSLHTNAERQERGLCNCSVSSTCHKATNA